MSGPVVVKLGGQLLDDPAVIATVAGAIGSAEDVVVVHGGGNSVDQLLSKLGIQTPKINGLRSTGDQAIGPVAGVLAGLVNKSLVAKLRTCGCDAVGLCLGDGGAVTVERVPDEALGNVGVVSGGKAALWLELLDAGRTPVVASIGIDDEGRLLNVNADDAALGAAIALRAASLVLVTDTSGVLGSQGKVIAELTTQLANDLIADGTIHSGMVPKVLAALAAAGALGAPVHIVPFAGLAAALAGERVGTVVMPPSRLRARGVVSPLAAEPV